MAHILKCLYIIHNLLHSLLFSKIFPNVRVAFRVLKKSQYIVFLILLLTSFGLRNRLYVVSVSAISFCFSGFINGMFSFGWKKFCSCVCSG